MLRIAKHVLIHGFDGQRLVRTINSTDFCLHRVVPFKDLRWVDPICTPKLYLCQKEIILLRVSVSFFFFLSQLTMS